VAVAYVLFALERPALFRIMFGEPCDRDSDERVAATATVAIYVRGIVERTFPKRRRGARDRDLGARPRTRISAPRRQARRAELGGRSGPDHRRSPRIADCTVTSRRMREWPPISAPEVRAWMALATNEWLPALMARSGKVEMPPFSEAAHQFGLAYPWDRPAGSYLLRDGEVRPIADVDLEAFTADRHPLVTFGANGAPTG